MRHTLFFLLLTFTTKSFAMESLEQRYGKMYYEELESSPYVAIYGDNNTGVAARLVKNDKSIHGPYGFQVIGSIPDLLNGLNDSEKYHLAHISIKQVDNKASGNDYYYDESYAVVRNGQFVTESMFTLENKMNLHNGKKIHMKFVPANYNVTIRVYMNPIYFERNIALNQAIKNSKKYKSNFIEEINPLSKGYFQIKEIAFINPDKFY